MPGGTIDPSKSARNEISEAEIDMNLAQTFPASDPPSWTLGVDHRAKSEPVDPRKRADDGDDATSASRKLNQGPMVPNSRRHGSSV
jgi:hypothetical protein